MLINILKKAVLSEVKTNNVCKNVYRKIILTNHMQECPNFITTALTVNVCEQLDDFNRHLSCASYIHPNTVSVTRRLLDFAPRCPVFNAVLSPSLTVRVCLTVTVFKLVGYSRQWGRSCSASCAMTGHCSAELLELLLAPNFRLQRLKHSVASEAYR